MSLRGVAEPTHLEPATRYTGDVMQGVAVISQLNVGDLEPGRKHRFFFQGIQMGTGQHWYVPIVVAKGIQAGKRICLIAGIHGDELNGVDAVQRTMASLDPATMAGTVIAVYDLCRPARELIQRGWPSTAKGHREVDLNRVWPGDEAGEDAPTRHVALVWNRLFRGNFDLAIDYHTQSIGGEYALFIFADYRNPEIQRIAELFPVQLIKDDPGEPGSLETTLVQSGIPCMTVEIGGPRGFDAAKVAIAVEGSLNVLKHYGIIPGVCDRTSKEVGTFIGNAMATVRATTGGYLQTLVDVNAAVTPGQTIAIQRNAFGDVVAEYTAPVAGRVATIVRDAIAEPGTRIMQILHSVDPGAGDHSGALRK